MAEAQDVNLTTAGFIDAGKDKSTREYDIILYYTYVKNGEPKTKEIVEKFPKFVEDGMSQFPEETQVALLHAINIIARLLYGIDD